MKALIDFTHVGRPHMIAQAKAEQYSPTALNDIPDQRVLLVAPWEAKPPRRLWGLRDMHKFEADILALFAAALGESAENARRFHQMPDIASAFANVMARLTAENTAKQISEQVSKQTGGKVQIDPHLIHQDIDFRKSFDERFGAELRDSNKRFLESAEQLAAVFRLPARWDSKVKRILNSIEIADAKTLEIQVTELIHDLSDTLKELLFLYIPPNRRDYFDQNEPPFGASVADKFPDAFRDVAAAARCFALDEWTACVSHLMRALETPLQVFAKRIGVAFPGPTDLENWKTIIDQMVSKIDADVKRLEGTPKSHARNEELQLLGDVALDFRAFKNAWRNGVAHGRDWHDEKEAERVYSAVKHFMQRMAALA